jgi:hypothetical protein
MAAHKFAQGQGVRYSPHRFQDSSTQGLYTIVRLLPEEGSVPQYRIKANIGGQERVAREDQLVK